MPESDIKDKSTAVIADDEAPSRDYIKEQLLSVWPDLDIVGEAVNGMQAKKMIEEMQPDCAFLDIKMPGLSGMEVAKETAGICRVVFITAYDQFAVDAFENEAVDYILKPVSEERLAKTVMRLKAQVASKTPINNTVDIFERLMLKMNAPPVQKYLKWIRTQVRENVILVPVKKVYFFQASDRYTLVMTKKEEYVIRKTITELEDELDPEMFIRIHRGTIVNADYIDKISYLPSSRGQLRLKGRPEIHHISRSYSNRFKQM
ncbi:MAG: LytTR family DNA-binding domain-containing protein [Desulfobacteraceae bacterium]|jgi:DNA-binding LytR/AlgR family response regulator